MCGGNAGFVILQNILGSTEKKNKEAIVEENKIRKIISEQLGIKLDRVKDETRLEEDLDADELDIVEMTMELEDELAGMEIPDEIANSWKTVGDIISYLKDR